MNIRTTKSDSVDDFLRLAQKGVRIEPKLEGLNPPIHCGFSKGLANPVEKTLDSETKTAVE